MYNTHNTFVVEIDGRIYGDHIYVDRADAAKSIEIILDEWDNGVRRGLEERPILRLMTLEAYLYKTRHMLR